MGPEVRTALLRLQTEAMQQEGFSPEYPQQNKHLQGREMKDVLKGIVERQYPAMTRKDQRILLGQLAKQVSRVLREKPPGFGDPILYSILTERAKEIANEARRKGFVLPNAIHVALIPSRQVHATLLSFRDGDEYLIAIGEGLLTYLHTCASCLAQMLPMKQTGESAGNDMDCLIESMENSPAAVQRFHLAILYHSERLLKKMYDQGGEIHAIVLHHPTPPPPYTVEWPRSVALQDLRDGMELFAVGHEYAHIIEQHVKNPATPTELQGLAQWAKNYHQEHEADATGALLAMGCLLHRGINMGRAYMAIDLFFSLISLLDRSLSIMSTGQEVVENTFPDLDSPTPPVNCSETHPSAILRRALFQHCMANHFRDEGLTALPSELHKLSDNMGKLIDTIFDKLRPQLKLYYEQEYKMRSPSGAGAHLR
jgi:hypothetical protein